MPCLLPVRRTIGPSSLLPQHNRFEHWDVVDGCPSNGKCAVSLDQFSLVAVETICSRCQNPYPASFFLVETGEAAPSADLNSSWRRECEEYVLIDL